MNAIHVVGWLVVTVVGPVPSDTMTRPTIVRDTTKYASPPASVGSAPDSAVMHVATEGEKRAGNRTWTGSRQGALQAGAPASSSSHNWTASLAGRAWVNRRARLLTGPVTARPFGTDSGASSAEVPAVLPQSSERDKAAPTTAASGVPGTSTGQPRPATSLTDPYALLRQRVRGDVQLTGEGYASVGQPGRRPGSSFRAQMSPSFDLGFGISLSTQILLSSEGAEFRQNINQAGFSPEWSWGKLYIADFSRGYSPFTTQGVRVRGGGLDLFRGPVRGSVQYGRTQRAVARPGSELAFTRNMFAASAGAGTVGERWLDLTVVRAADDPNSVERALLIADSLALDSLVADTLLDPFRPRPGASTRPMDNLVVGLGGGLPLFGRRLRLRGEVAGSVLSLDRTRPLAADGAGGRFGFVNALIPLRLSTTADAAWSTDAQLSLGATSLSAAVERVGAGYQSLGLGYLINDRQSISLGGATSLAAGRVTLQAQGQRMNDNLAGQKAFETYRDNLVLGMSFRPTTSVGYTLSGLVNEVGNDAQADSVRQQLRVLGLTQSLALTGRLLGLAATSSLTWAYQSTIDAAPIPRTPNVTVNNVTAALQLAVRPGVTVSPNLSLAQTNITGGTSDRNLFAGFQASARGWKNRLNSSAALSRTFTAGRHVTGARAQATVQMPFEAALQVQGRWTNYSALGLRPAFSESFLTVAMSRPF
jgi:hypothetical protein